MPFRKPVQLVSLGLFLALLLLLSGTVAQVAAVPADVFFSEYVEGSSLNKALEIYNGTGAAVDLAAGGYKLEFFFNGAVTAGTTINLTGTVGAGDVYIVADDGADPAILAVADQLDTASFFNGDDAIVLSSTSSAMVDVIGQVGFDPGTEWGSGDASTADNTIRRKAEVCAGDTNRDDAFDPSLEWDGYPNNTFAGLGAHTANCDGGPPPVAEVLLTELVVTPTAGEFIEIHNPTAGVIDLSNYYVTDATFSGDGTYYYNIVTGVNAGGGAFADFNARFPDGATIGAGEYQTIAMEGSEDFFAQYGFDPTYELYEDGSPDAVPDMREATTGSINNQGGLTNSGEVVILYYWDGATDLVTDVDYALWGDKEEAVDKTGVSIDGPDADPDASSYLPDTAIVSQDIIAGSNHADGTSWQREDLTEGNETSTGGNGVNGEDETSEDLSNTWCTAAPTPGAATFCPPPPPPISLVINEIHADPATDLTGDANGDGVRDATQDEFLEIVNDSDTAADISGWTLSDSVQVRHTFPAGSVIPANCSIVLFGGGDPTGAFGGSAVQTASTASLGLNNTGDTVTLNDGVSNVATYVYGSEGNFDQSLTRDPDVTGPDPLVQHTTATGSGGALFSPGTKIDASLFAGCAAPLLLTEVVVTPTEGEFVEIHNAGAAAVDLSNVYLTDATFSGSGAYYYNLVTGVNAGGGGFADFNARFPDGASIGPGEYQTIAVAGSDDFFAEYGVDPTYELFEDGTPDAIPDMREATPGSINNQGGLSNDGEVVILYYWDGASDLVIDLDYGLWGDKVEGVDKTGVLRDGPDADSDLSSYLPDTAIADQDILSNGSHAGGASWQRDDLSEGNETPFGGNGSGGNDETSENVSDTWCEDAPTPNAASSCPDLTPIELAIYEIQGNGDTSPYVTQYVTTTGVVVADFQGSDQLQGFFVQDPDGDSDVTTSDGIFVYDPGGVDVNVGDLISVTGQVAEFNTLTEINNVSDISVHSTAGLPLPALITLPETVNGELEQYEGMYVEIAGASDMIVAQNFFLGRYGQMTLAAGGRPFQPTNQFEPLSPDAIALAEENARRLLILDDGQDINGLGDNPDPVPYIGPPPPSVIRAGDGVSNLIGVLDFGRINSASDPARDYRLHPTVAPLFTPANLRTTDPGPVGGTLKVASFNVLNYFTTIDTGSFICGPGGDQECRGADSASEFTRQQDKIVAAIAAIDADILGLIELENNAAAEPPVDGLDPVLETLVAALNAVMGAGTYDFIDAGVIGTDAIKQAFIYKPATVTPVGSFEILDSSDDPTFIDTRNRPVLAQTFMENASGEAFTVAVNHLKSKGSPCDPDDPDTGDGQGNCNLTRLAAAQALVNWLATDPTGSGDSDFLIIGDLNSYAMEDPIRAIQDAGYTNLISSFLGANAYSYIFDGLSGYLDHALANASLTPYVTGVADWHINADEPAVIDYDENFNPPGYYSDDPYRATDHDPVIVGLQFNAAPICTAAYPSHSVLWIPNHKFVKVIVLGVTDPDGDPVTILTDSIFQDEAVDAPGSGHTAPDGKGVGYNGAKLRAERIIWGNGRVYHIAFTASDDAGGSCSGVVKVEVRRVWWLPAIDNGPLYDSTLIP